MIPLKDRQIKATISHRKRKPADTLDDAFDINSPATIKESIEYDQQFRIDFTFDRTADITKPDTGTLKIYNPLQDFFADIQDSHDLYIVIEGGYKDYTGRLIAGVCSDYLIERNGTDVIMSFMIGDGLNALRKQTNKTYPKDTPYSKIVDDMLTDLKTAGTEIIASAQKWVKDKIAGKTESGENFSGSTAKALDKIMRAKGIEPVIANNEMFFREFAKPIDRYSIVLSHDTGLLTARKTTLELKDSTGKVVKKSAVEFECLMIPDIVPGQQINIKSQFINKGESTLMTVYSCTGDGSNFGSNFFIRGIAHE